MLFNSLDFVAFLVVAFAAYWLARRSCRWQNVVVVVASFGFYASFDWRFCFLVLLTSLVSFGTGLLMGRWAGHRRGQWWLSLGNIVVNAGILCTFKYFDFFSQSIAAVLRELGLQVDAVTLHLVLPVGISFYTFQALSYTVDVYRGKVEPTRDVAKFLAFITFFPQLLAGPIETASHMLPQFSRARTFSYDQAVDGCRQMLCGFLKKVVVADNLQVYVNYLWGDIGGQSGGTLAVGLMIYAVQLYCDFSGYSDISIGVGKLFGLELVRNFNVPFFSRDMAELWRRWHISLMRWFRDYIYIPLGGNRCSKGRHLANVFVVFLVCGLWHGADWTFVLWGLIHAVLIVAGILLGINKKRAHVAGYGRVLPSMKELAMVVAVFLLFALSMVLFRADDLGQTCAYLAQMCSAGNFLAGGVHGLAFMALGMGVLAWEWVMRTRAHGFEFAGHGLLRYRLMRIVVYYVALWAIVYQAGVDTQFIYFQF